MQRENEPKQRERWERMKKRGRIPHLAINVSIFLGSYAVVRLLHILCFKLGWLRSPGSTSWEDVFFCAVLTGAIFGELQWSDLKRKFKDPPPEEDWMSK